MPSRWDHLLDLKPVPLLEHLKEEISKLLAKDLAGWPPPITDIDPGFAQKNADLFSPDARKPADAVYLEAFRLARWEMERDIEAVDEYMRNQRFIQFGVAAPEKSALLFLSRWLTDQMLGLAEATENRVKRKDLIEILDRTQRKLGLSTIVRA